MIQRYELTGSQALGLCMERDENGDFVLFDDHNAQLAACAAGPWRTDVENAPKDTPLQVWCKIHPANTGHDLRIGKLDSRSKTWTDGVWRLYVTAFAIPNPPQVTA